MPLACLVLFGASRHMHWVIGSEVSRPLGRLYVDLTRSCAALSLRCSRRYPAFVSSPVCVLLSSPVVGFPWNSLPDRCCVSAVSRNALIILQPCWRGDEVLGEKCSIILWLYLHFLMAWRPWAVTFRRAPHSSLPSLMWARKTSWGSNHPIILSPGHTGSHKKVSPEGGTLGREEGALSLF